MGSQSFNHRFSGFAGLHDCSHFLCVQSSGNGGNDRNLADLIQTVSQLRFAAKENLMWKVEKGKKIFKLPLQHHHEQVLNSWLIIATDVVNLRRGESQGVVEDSSFVLDVKRNSFITVDFRRNLSHSPSAGKDTRALPFRRRLLRGPKLKTTHQLSSRS